MVQQSVAGNHIDDAISLLNAYFNLKDRLEGVESQLRGRDTFPTNEHTACRMVRIRAGFGAQDGIS